MTMANIRTRGLSAVLLPVAAALTLSACGAGSMPNPQMASAKVPVVSQTMMAFNLPYSASGDISPAQRQSLTEWLDSININYGDRISIDDPNVGADKRRGTVARVLANYGLLLSENVPVVSGAVQNGVARVIVMRATAAVPECPDWRRQSNPEFEASSMSNYGCATMTNLAAMIVDANDLVSGKTHPGVDAESTAKAIETYRQKVGEASDKVKSSVGSASK